MEKVIYALWARPGEDHSALNARLADRAPELLTLTGVRSLRLNLQDAHVARAERLRMRTPEGPQPDAAIQLWLDAAHDAFRAPLDGMLRALAGGIAAWSVLESTIIANTVQRPQPGARTDGWSQLCFLKRPARLDHATWRHNWQVLHTPVAVRTQANFEYIQNLIIRPLLEGPVPYVAIVEECFPASAMDDPHVFFDAVGDEERFAANTAAMAESCGRFIDADGVDLLPTSQYDLGWQAPDVPGLRLAGTAPTQ